ncbi:MAG: carboxypeptidase [Chthonomonadales bacterium]|nr:carboxypeptidase [Chthonomonadales bacterium]
MSDGMRFDVYYNYEDLGNHLHDLAARFPELLHVHSIGESYEGRPIWCATLTQSSAGPAEDKPALYIDGNIHATEVSASTACLYFLQWMLEHYGSDPDVTRCLETRAFYVVPRLNPDGPERYLSPKRETLRSSVRPYPYDEEPIGGLKREDLDGDGRILTMRIPDPNGPWKIDDEDPRLMVRREPTETGGNYYRLLPEGTIEDWDGVTIGMRPTKEGLDLNRNYPAQWRPENEQSGAGPFPTSEPEIRATVAFIASHPNIIGGISFHTYSGVLLRPYGTQSDETLPAEDLWTYQAIGDKGKELTGYPAISVYHDFRYHPKEVITGVFDDWLYDHFGAYGWTVEIWCPQREAGIPCFGPDKPDGGYRFIDWYREHPLDDDRKLLKWNDEVLGGKGFVEWRSFDHPQLGRVEIGGWDSAYCWRNPPPERLESEVARFPRWLLWHALISPRIVIERFEATKLSDGVYRVRLVVDNEGWLPTYVSKKALERKAARAPVAELALPDGVELQVGKIREELPHLEGKAYKSPGAIGWVADPSEERTKKDYILRGSAGDTVKVTVRCQRAGAACAVVTLP